MAKKRLSQKDVPRYSLEDALRIPKAIGDNYAYDPTTPFKVAQAMDFKPNSSHFRSLSGSAIAYGLTDGGYNAENIEVLELAQRILRPLQEGDDLKAKREALLQPNIINQFLNKYHSSPIPREDIAHNVLIDMGVPKKRVEDVFELILDSAESVGFLVEIKDKLYIDLDGAEPINESEEDESSEEPEGEKDLSTPQQNSKKGYKKSLPVDLTDKGDKIPEESEIVDKRKKKVFITHGKNRKFINPIKKLLQYGELDAVTSVDKQSVSKPVPEKVLSDMRECGAAIIHVEAEKKLIDEDANEHAILNSNVLIEIGAAMALFGKRFILLVKEGVELPSNLQGLYEVRYEGNNLDGNSTIKLLESINDIKNHPLP